MLSYNCSVQRHIWYKLYHIMNYSVEWQCNGLQYGGTVINGCTVHSIRLIRAGPNHKTRTPVSKHFDVW